MHTLLCSHSVAINLITSKVRYCLWITAELFTSRLRASATHARYANSTNQSSADKCSLWKFGKTNRVIVTPGIHAHARHATLSYTWHGISKHRNPAEIARQRMGLWPKNRFIAIGADICAHGAKKSILSIKYVSIIAIDFLCLWAILETEPCISTTTPTRDWHHFNSSFIVNIRDDTNTKSL